MLQPIHNPFFFETSTKTSCEIYS